MRSYAFIYVEGFSRDNLSLYILRFFGSDEVAGQDLITFIEDTDVIRENMAPYPIYTAMLCVMWRESDRERRETIRSLQTFSQVFQGNDSIPSQSPHIQGNYRSYGKGRTNRSYRGASPSCRRCCLLGVVEKTTSIFRE